MCTAIAHFGKDTIYGFNLDINEGAFPYDIYASKDWFCIGCLVDREMVIGSGKAAWPPFYSVTDGIRKIHGVNRQGQFAACLNNMNFHKAPFRLSSDACSIDQVMDDIISGRRTVEEVRRFAEEVEIVTLPFGTVDVPDPGFHALCADASGHVMLLEPGNGYAVLREKNVALTNFAVLEPPADLTDATAGYYGKDRYDTALRILREHGDDLSLRDAFGILEAVCQRGNWATRISFAYSHSEKTVYYCREGDFRNIIKHQFVET